MNRGKPIKNILLNFLQSAGIQEKYEENIAVAYWESIVGDEIARHTEPQKVADGTVFVKVDDNVWRNELVFFKKQIIAKLNTRIGKNVIKDVKFY